MPLYRKYLAAKTVEAHIENLLQYNEKYERLSKENIFVHGYSMDIDNGLSFRLIWKNGMTSSAFVLGDMSPGIIVRCYDSRHVVFPGNENGIFRFHASEIDKAARLVLDQLDKFLGEMLVAR